MKTLSRHRGWLIAITVLAVGAVLMITVPDHADAGDQDQAVTSWVQRHSTPLTTVDADASLQDLAPLRRSIGDATVVGLGESVHGAAEVETMKHRVLRVLVERMGFRSVAWEEDWTIGVQIDRYIRTGAGDLDEIMGQMSGQWQSRETMDVLRWLRDYNRGRSDKVRFFGVEYIFTRSLAYDRVDDYVAEVAPQQLARLRRDLDAIRPTKPNIFEHIEWFASVDDKDSFVDRARRVRGLVEGISHRQGDRQHAAVLHAARQIESFYEHFSMPESKAHTYRDAHAAQNLRWWQRLTDDKVAYWAASPHTANAPRLRIATPPQEDLRFASVGSYLRRWIGRRYLSIGFTFDHGNVNVGPDATKAMPPPTAGWFERPFGAVPVEQFALDLRTSAPDAVHQWLHADIVTRGLPDGVPTSYMDGGTLAEWFDVSVHRQVVTPTTSYPVQTQ